jgi:hypothetical protein
MLRRHKKKLRSEAESSGRPLRLEAQAKRYQVEGEVGRFSFELYQARDGQGEAILDSVKWLPARRPREWYKTEGFRQAAVFWEASQRSYRETTTHLNRWRRQEQGGTPTSTLHANAVNEGARVLSFLETQSRTLWEHHGFDRQGSPCEDAEVVKAVAQGRYASLSTSTISQGWEQVRQAMHEREFSEEQIRQAEQRARAGIDETASGCTQVSIDEVGVNKQKAHRETKDPAAARGETRQEAEQETGPKGSGSRPQVANTVACIEHQGQRFTLTGESLVQVLRFVLAFLLNNELLNGRLPVFTDGKRSLQATLLAFFVWHTGCWLVLDWYHLVKKFKEDLSLACRGRELRNQHLRKLVKLLWYGLVGPAQAYLAAIPSKDIKDPHAVTRLENYLVRNERAIPCYALRSKLGLRNASSPVESANNEVTARRQKHQGMSWSTRGSQTMTALRMVVCNRCCETWVRDDVIPLDFSVKAA